METGAEFIRNNYNEGDKVILYGYSNGGDQAVNTAEELDGEMRVSFTTIVDSSDGNLNNLTVDGTIQNSYSTLNIYQPEGGVSTQTYVTQAGMSAFGGVAVSKINSSSLFKSTVVGTYMRTTSSLGQTAGTAVANTLMNAPDYTRATIQNKMP